MLFLPPHARIWALLHCWIACSGKVCFKLSFSVQKFREAGLRLVFSSYLFFFKRDIFASLNNNDKNQSIYFQNHSIFLEYFKLSHFLKGNI